MKIVVMIFTSISWQAYFTFIGICLFTWYTVIYFSYFRKPSAAIAGIKKWLYRQRSVSAPAPATADRSLAIYQQAKNELVDFLENAAIESWDKPAVAQSLSLLFDRYRSLNGTHYTNLLAQVINDSKYQFNTQELESIWNNNQ
jgi:hypothetical protein